MAIILLHHCFFCNDLLYFLCTEHIYLTDNNVLCHFRPGSGNRTFKPHPTLIAPDVSTSTIISTKNRRSPELFIFCWNTG